MRDDRTREGSSEELHLRSQGKIVEEPSNTTGESGLGNLTYQIPTLA
jgi:hypothetical protein